MGIEFEGGWQSIRNQLWRIELSEEEREQLDKINLLFESKDKRDWKLAYQLLENLPRLNLYTFIHSSNRSKVDAYFLENDYDLLVNQEFFRNISYTLSENIIYLKKLKYFQNGHLFFSERDFSLLGEVSNLEVVIIYGEGSPEIFPHSLTKLSQLKELYLDYKGGQFKSIPPEIGNLKNLEVLTITYNRIKKLPPEIGKLKKLKVLNLHTSLLTTLPVEIGELENLEYLNLELNEDLMDIPDSIFNLKKLKYLIIECTDLSDSRRQEIKKGFPHIDFQFDEFY